MSESNKVLFGIEAICNHFCMKLRMFYSLIERGMPVKKLNKVWMCHTDAVEEWIRIYTTQGPSSSS